MVRVVQFLLGVCTGRIELWRTLRNAVTVAFVGGMPRGDLDFCCFLLVL